MTAMASRRRRSLADRLETDEREFRTAVRRLEHRPHTAERVRLLGFLHTGLGALGVAVGMLAFLAIAPWGFLSGDPAAAAILGGIGTVVAAVVFAVSLPGLVLGIGLLQRRAWSRTFGIVVGALSLLSVPIGTVVGALTIYVLVQDDTDAYLRGSLLD